MCSQSNGPPASLSSQQPAHGQHGRGRTVLRIDIPRIAQSSLSDSRQHNSRLAGSMSTAGPIDHGEDYRLVHCGLVHYSERGVCIRESVVVRSKKEKKQNRQEATWIPRQVLVYLVDTCSVLVNPTYCGRREPPELRLCVEY